MVMPPQVVQYWGEAEFSVETTIPTEVDFALNNVDTAHADGIRSFGHLKKNPKMSEEDGRFEFKAFISEIVEPACIRYFSTYHRTSNSLRHRVEQLKRGEYKGQPIDFPLATDKLVDCIDTVEDYFSRGQRGDEYTDAKEELKRLIKNLPEVDAQDMTIPSYTQSDEGDDRRTRRRGENVPDIREQIQTWQEISDLITCLGTRRSKSTIFGMMTPHRKFRMHEADHPDRGHCEQHRRRKRHSKAKASRQ